MHYRNASPRLCGLNVGLKVQRGVEIAAGVPIASALDSVHADRHRAVLVRLHRLEGVRKPALRLAAFARPALKLATYLQQERTRMAWHSIYVAKGVWGAWGWGAKPGAAPGTVGWGDKLVYLYLYCFSLEILYCESVIRLGGLEMFEYVVCNCTMST